MFTMEKYAVIKLGSKQFLVHEGDVFELERQKQPLDIKVLFYSDGEKSDIGEPEVKGISVKASVIDEKKGDKVRVARFKSKSRYDKVRGHRQPLSVIKIEKIGKAEEIDKAKEVAKDTESKKSAKKPVKKVEKKVETKKSTVKKTATKTTAKKTTEKKETKSKSSKGSK